MNSLSWLIYLAEVIGTFRDAFGILAGILIFGVVCIVFLSGGEVFADDAATIRKWLYRAFIASFVLGTISMLMPSTRTLYLIAASEVGQQVATTPEAKEVFSEIRTSLLRQLKTLNGDK